MRDNSNNKRRTLLRVISVICAALILLIISVIILLYRALNMVHYEQVNQEIPEIDPAYASGYGVFFPERETVKDNTVMNILFLGTDYQLQDETRGRADSNILCSLNMRSGEIKLVSFERGIGVPVPGRGSDLLTYAYHWGGPELSQAILSQMFCVDIRAYVQVDFSSFASIIDAMGGVSVELTGAEARALNGWVPTNTWAWAEVQEGWNHLSGHDALEYCRLRSVDDNWNRQRRQRTVLEQMRKRCRELSLPERIQLAETVLPMIHTNLSKADIIKLFLKLPKLLRNNVIQLQVPDQNFQEGYIRCIPDYEARKIENFLYGTDYELKSPY